MRQATEALARQDGASAKSWYQAAAAAEPNNVQLLLSAAATALRYDQDALALQLAQSAQSLHPGEAAPQRTLATIYYRQGNYTAAREALSRAIALDKAHPLSYFLMGSTLRKLGEADTADWHFRQAAQLDPSYAARR
jgi:Flp pilus assembly protein TadD